MNTHDDTRPTIAERYASAIEATNLKVSTETRGPVDMIIAAGWSDNLGAGLARLRAEFDSVRAEHAAAVAVAAKGEQAARKAGAGKAPSLLKEAMSAALTARAVILIRLKSLASVKEELGRAAVRAATVNRFMGDDATVLVLVGRCLDVWLDPLCPACDGRGFNGGGRHENSGPPIRCRPCQETGRRRNEVGKDDEERAFAKLILAGMDEVTTRAEKTMSMLLRTRD